MTDDIVIRTKADLQEAKRSWHRALQRGEIATWTIERDAITTRFEVKASWGRLYWRVEGSGSGWHATRAEARRCAT